MNAAISHCGSYRFALWRTLQRRLPPFVDEEGGTVLFIMLNPSTADDVEDDPTIRRCLAFARREGMARVAVGNLYALRATNPRALARHPFPVGPGNDAWLSDLAANADLIVAAWGASPFADPERVQTVLRMLRPAPVRCLGLTRAGHPRHPLYVPSEQPLESFDPLAVAA